jgi:hypothetical protein
LVMAGILSSFIIWRAWRSEYKDEEIFAFTVFLAAGGSAGGLFGGEWGLVIGIIVLLWKWCRDKKWDFWEWADYLAVLGMWFWFWGSLSRGPDLFKEVVAAGSGVVILAMIKRTYRRLKWYKSGKMGLVFLGALMWFALAQIWVAFLTPIKVYYFGLTVSQWIAVWAVSAAAVVVYFRSKV